MSCQYRRHLPCLSVSHSDSASVASPPRARSATAWPCLTCQTNRSTASNKCPYTSTLGKHLQHSLLTSTQCRSAAVPPSPFSIFLSPSTPQKRRGSGWVGGSAQRLTPRRWRTRPCAASPDWRGWRGRRGQRLFLFKGTKCSHSHMGTRKRTVGLRTDESAYESISGSSAWLEANSSCTLPKLKPPMGFPLLVPVLKPLETSKTPQRVFVAAARRKSPAAPRCSQPNPNIPPP